MPEQKELSLQFEHHNECLRRRSENYNRFDEEHIEVISVIKGSDVIFPCFPCVSPEDAVEIESTYKPSSGSVGRVFKKAVDFFKKRLSPGWGLFDERKWKYDWEFARPGRIWRDLTNIHQRQHKLDAVSEKIKRFLSRDSDRQTLGDRYELTLKNVDVNNTGFYRCINKYKKVHRISLAFFLDVRSESKTQMVASGSPEIQSAYESFPERKFMNQSLKARIRPYQWSICNKCGNQTNGEEIRLHQCVIEPNIPFLNKLPKSSDWIKLFGTAPCDSSIVPLSLRKFIGQTARLIEYRPCNNTCKSLEIEDRNITSVDELSDFRVLDYIPKGEFLFGEILPRLLAPVIRKAYLVVEGDSIVLSCIVNPDEPTGIQWHTDKILNFGIEIMKEKFKGRITLDESSRLIISNLQLTDSGFYYCYNTEKVLVAVHNLMVTENEKTKEILANMEMFLRFVAFTLIVIMIISRLLE
ncbi:unnamed protein product [Auanema sp. JU1783]|nr:unnamed protein product [Auanema sp. JU1783]